MTARPKFRYVRSKALMEAYREIPCQSCGADDGTVAGAHSNSGKMGKGLGRKATDYCASLCSKCHAKVDSSYSMTGEQRQAMWQAAHEKTVHELIKQWLWPTDVRYPDWLK